MKIAIVAPRFGQEVVGGSETWAMETAKLLLKHKHSVEVITTTGIDIGTWLGKYPEGKSIVEDIPVTRFRVSENRWGSAAYNGDMLARYNLPRIDPVYGKLRTDFSQYAKAADLMSEVPLHTGLQFVKEQGPYSQDMMDYLLGNRAEWDRVIFIPYLCASSLYGSRMIDQSKVRIVLAAHDEAWIHMRCFKEYFSYHIGVFYPNEYAMFADAQKEKNEHDYTQLVPNMESEGDYVTRLETSYAITKDYNPENKYLVYTGRASAMKGTDLLIKAVEHTRNYPGFENLELVMTGTCEIDISKYPWIHFLGKLPRPDMYDTIRGAMALVNPSYLDSLGYSNLEAMLVGTPVIANQNCPAFVGLSETSKSVLLFNPSSPDTLRTAVNHINDTKVRSDIADSATKWIKDECSEEKSYKALERFLT